MHSILKRLASSVTGLLQCHALRPHVFGGSAGQQQRRGLLDMAAWARDVVYVVAGHCSSAVTCRPTISRRSDTKIHMDLASHAEYDDFKVAAQHAAWQQQCRTVEHYRQLRLRNRWVADKFLSHILKASDAFTIALHISPLRT